MSLKLYGVADDARTLKIQTAALCCGVELDFFGIKKGNYKKGITPTGKFPVLYQGDKVAAFTANASVKFIGDVAGDKKVFGNDVKLGKAQVDQWCEYSTECLEHLCEVAVLDANAKVPGAASMSAADKAKCSDDALASLVNELAKGIEKHLMSRTFLVGESLTVADLAVCSALLRPFKEKISPKVRASRLPNTTRWLETVVNQGKFATVLTTPFSLNKGALSKKKSSGKAKSGGKKAASSFTGASTAGAASSTKIKTLFKRSRTRVREILKSSLPLEQLVGQSVVVCGWARTVREQQKGTLAFIEINDGSCFESLQIVCTKADTEGFEGVLSSGGIGSSFRITGTLVESPAKGQTVEVKGETVEVLGNIDADKYPLKKTGKSQKGHSVEFLREHAHLRSRTHLIGAVARVRNACAHAVHQFFNERGFLYVHTPLITASDCEGAGEMFAVTTLLGDAAKNGGKLPIVDEKVLKSLPKDMKHPPKVGEIDYRGDFFGRPSFLTVSGQLNVETYACALSDVYTFGPTFRAENSFTSRHLAEFWMIEPELCFATLEDDMNLAEDFLKFCTQYCLDNCASDIDFFDKRVEPGLKKRLQNVLNEPFKRLTYTEAIDILNKPEHMKAGSFEEKPDWGIDLGSEHERYLTEKVFKKPVILTDYPADIKAFYMRQNELDSEGRLTVQAMDILVPRIGEIIGGSAREERLELLEKRIVDMNLDMAHFDWYCDLRKYGSVPHAGFGLGFERMVLFITGVQNIRDVIPFPRWPKHCEF